MFTHENPHNPEKQSLGDVQEELNKIKELSRFGIAIARSHDDPWAVAEYKRAFDELKSISDRFVCPPGYRLLVHKVDESGAPTVPPLFSWNEVNEDEYYTKPAPDDRMVFYASELRVGSRILESWLIDTETNICTPYEMDTIIQLVTDDEVGGGSAGDREPRAPIKPLGTLGASLEI
ncbi:MAG TPA: hypothetical protein V6C72_16245 [Chroococcales cyanobacterium]